MPEPPDIRQQIDALYRSDSRRVFATLVRLLGDLDRAEEATQNAFAAALEQWPADGIPGNPIAWLVSAGRFGAIDAARRRAQLKAALPLIAAEQSAPAASPDADEIEDDRLRLIFTCCHPALSPALQIPLTLREVCDLTTDEIAAAFLSTPATIAQRIVRAKAKIRLANIPYAIPSRADMPQRLESVLSVIYLVFTEGYSASSGNSLTRTDLSAEAIRLARLLSDLLPANDPDPEPLGLLALLLFQDSRRLARTSPTGDLILLEDQDHSLWNRAQIDQAAQLVERAFATGTVGPYALQAAIAAVHAGAPSPAQTNWPRIVALYDLLQQAAPSPIVSLNRAVALAMRDGPAAALPLIDTLLATDLPDYHLAHAARADLLRRLGQTDNARDAYQRALALCRQDPERRFLKNRLRDLPQK
jgi:RNA polymerase sigma-70 factor (ECF subfamily)